MRLGILLITLVLVLLAAFVTLNWPALITFVPLSLGVATVPGPLGLIMLALLLLLAGPAIFFAFLTHRTGLIRAGRDAEQMRLLRELADRAETSRFTELRDYLGKELHQLREQHLELQAELHSGLEALDDQLAILTVAATADPDQLEPPLSLARETGNYPSKENP